MHLPGTLRLRGYLLVQAYRVSSYIILLLLLLLLLIFFKLLLIFFFFFWGGGGGGGGVTIFPLLGGLNCNLTVVPSGLGCL